VKVDMSPEAVTARLKRVSQLRRLCLALGKATPVAPAPSTPMPKRETGGISVGEIVRSIAGMDLHVVRVGMALGPLHPVLQAQHEGLQCAFA
jgi:hypothetical protein